jgi:uncharacterized protein (TIGR00725 family)
MKQKLQIAIVGSASDGGYGAQAEKTAKEIGREVAGRGHILVYGPELMMPSLSYLAARAAKDSGGTTLAVAIGCARTRFFDPAAASIVVYTEASGGAGREVVLVNSADVVIGIAGGAGTLVEMSIAYMNSVPVVAIEGLGGWSEKIAGQYLDSRQRYKIPTAHSAKQAVELAESMSRELAEVASHFDE